jgi:N-acetylglucosamine-6-sulfatase
MVQTKRLLQDDPNGVFLSNWRIHTPICSPSRSETVSGRYFHNIKSTLAVPPPHLEGAATAHVNSSLYDQDAFGVHLRAKKGYNVGLFGKSNFNTMQGFDRWFSAAVCGFGGSYQDNESPSFRTKVNASEYGTTTIANKAIEWLQRSNVSGTAAKGYSLVSIQLFQHTRVNVLVLSEMYLLIVFR